MKFHIIIINIIFIHSPNQAKSKIELLKLLHLSRASEISADRAGFLGSGNIEHSLKAMLKITSGLGEDHLTFNFSSYLDQLRELKQIKGDQNQMYSTHPIIFKQNASPGMVFNES